MLGLPSGASMRRLVESRCFCFFIHGRFCFCGCCCLCSVGDSSRASIRTRSEPLWARCLLGPDGDELGLLSEGRPGGGGVFYSLFPTPWSLLFKCCSWPVRAFPGIAGAIPRLASTSVPAQH